MTKTKPEHTAAVEQAATINEAVEQANARIAKRAKAAAKPKQAKAAKPAKAKTAKPKRTPKPKSAEPKKPKEPRVTNGDRIAKLAEQPDGFSIEDVTTMLGVQPHTARAIISVELRQRRGINLVCSKGRYTVAPAA
jgi:hypothetical protein